MFENRGSTGIFVPKGAVSRRKPQEILSYFEDFQHRNRLFGAKRRCLRFFKQALGNRIREERLRLHLTQAQLAEDVDISDTYMGAIERGERSLTLDTLVRLVNRLGVTVDYLLADSVSDSDANIMEQFKQIVDQQPLERKQMAINVLRTIFSYFDDTEGA